MLIPYSRSQFVTKILTSPTGEQFRVVFLVALVDGKIKAQVISSERLSKQVPNTSAVYLPLALTKDSTVFDYVASFNPVVSPFNSLFFFNSQPTRAPSF